MKKRRVSSKPIYMLHPNQASLFKQNGFKEGVDFVVIKLIPLKSIKPGRK